LPYWSTFGFDWQHRQFHERLDFSGRPLTDAPYRLMVQARQVFVFAHAAALGWYAEGASLAESALATMIKRHRSDAVSRSGFTFSTTRAGALVDSRRDSYTHAFVLFALAAVYRLNGDRKLLALAEETVAFVEHALHDRRHHGVFDEAGPGAGSKRQNPHMHLLEAYIALEQAAPGRGFAERACDVVKLFKDSMYDRERRVLPEHFSRDWGPHPETAKRHVFEPGHHYEWLWLLSECEKYGVSCDDIINDLGDVAAKHGTAQDGALHDEVGADYGVRKSSRRLWPHTEGAKAATAKLRRGHDDAAELGQRMIKVLMTQFVGKPFTGGWVDHFDEAGAPKVDYVPASSLYHLTLAASELARALPGARPIAPHPMMLREAAEKGALFG
jgi:mannose-6-phosphate isomerase